MAHRHPAYSSPILHEQLAIELAPPLAASEVHLHWLAFAPFLGIAGSLAGDLSAEERQRAARLRPGGVAERFLLSHAFARRVLGSYLGAPALDVALGVDPYGRPLLIGIPAGGDGGLSYSLAHSTSHTVVAVARTPFVGVDVEEQRPEVDVLGIARRFLAREEVEALGAVPADARPAAFARLWACKEAFLKAIGLGMRHPLDRFAVGGVEAGSPRLVRVDPAWGSPEDWSLVAAMPAGGCFLASAVRLRHPSVLCFTASTP